MSRKRRTLETVPTLNVQELCESLETSQFPQVEITMDGVTLPFRITYGHNREIHMFMQNTAHASAGPLCFSFRIRLEANDSSLDYLLFTARENCPGPSVPHLGSWLLGLVDRVNECLDLSACYLDNVASFQIGRQPYPADCVYSRDHHGLGFYMSRGWLVQHENETIFANLVHRTNLQIEAWNEWWNERRHLSPEQVCGSDFPKARDMVKIYGAKVQIYTPRNALAPAVVYVEGALNETRVQTLETFDYRAGQEALQEYRAAVARGETSFEILYEALRRAYPAPRDEDLRAAVNNEIQTIEADIRDVRYHPYDYSLNGAEFPWMRAQDVAHVFPGECKTGQVVTISQDCEVACFDPSAVYRDIRAQGLKPSRRAMAVLFMARHPLDFCAEVGLHERTGLSRNEDMTPYFQAVRAILERCRAVTEFEDAGWLQALLKLPVIPMQHRDAVLEAMRFLCVVDLRSNTSGDTNHNYELTSEPVEARFDGDEVRLVYVFPFLPAQTNTQVCVPPTMFELPIGSSRNMSTLSIIEVHLRFEAVPIFPTRKS